uniref:LDL receptor related protein 11 n=1 Tax=Macaca fascicularis TaxID=9541 RepID=A0A7N9IFG4_MACFA
GCPPRAGSPSPGGAGARRAGRGRAEGGAARRAGSPRLHLAAATVRTPGADQLRSRLAATQSAAGQGGEAQSAAQPPSKARSGARLGRLCLPLLRFTPAPARPRPRGSSQVPGCRAVRPGPRVSRGRAGGAQGPRSRAPASPPRLAALGCQPPWPPPPGRARARGAGDRRVTGRCAGCCCSACGCRAAARPCCLRRRCPNCTRSCRAWGSCWRSSAGSCSRSGRRRSWSWSCARAAAPRGLPGSGRRRLQRHAGRHHPHQGLPGGGCQLPAGAGGRAGLAAMRGGLLLRAALLRGRGGAPRRPSPPAAVLGCYLFNCTARGRNVCKFALHRGYSSYSLSRAPDGAALATARASPRLGCLHTCSRYHFFCDDGCCIDITLACDGVQQCPDGSDEDFCQNLGLDRKMVTHVVASPALPGTTGPSEDAGVDSLVEKSQKATAPNKPPALSNTEKRNHSAFWGPESQIIPVMPDSSSSRKDRKEENYIFESKGDGGGGEHPAPETALLMEPCGEAFGEQGLLGQEELCSGNPPASASQSAGITGMSHHVQPEK